MRIRSTLAIAAVGASLAMLSGCASVAPSPVAATGSLSATPTPSAAASSAASASSSAAASASESASPSASVSSSSIVPTTVAEQGSPEGKPCTSTYGVTGTYSWDGNSNSWSCRAS